VQPLVGVLDDRVHQCRVSAAEALVGLSFHSAKVVRILTEASAIDPCFSDQHAREVFQKIGDAATEPLTSMLRDKDKRVRRTAAGLLHYL
jgi:HEAT repeat protein